MGFIRKTYIRKVFFKKLRWIVYDGKRLVKY